MTRTSGRLSALGALLLLAAGTTSCSRSTSGGSKASQAERLTVTSTAPSAGAEDVAPDTPVSVTFSVEIDFATVTPSSFGVEGSRTGKRAGAYSHAARSRTVVFTTSGGFDDGEIVLVRLTGGIRSTAGASLEARELRFWVRVPPVEGPEPPPPGPQPGIAVVSTSPAAGDPSVPLDAVILVTMNGVPDPASLTSESVRVWGSLTGRIPARLETGLDAGKAFRVVPLRLFEAGEEVTLQLSASIRGLAEERFAGSAVVFRAAAAAPPGPRESRVITRAVGRVRELYAADLNLDRVSDVVHAVENETVVDLLLGRGDGTFRLALRIDLGQAVLSLLVADADGDGDPDVIVGLADRARVFWNRSLEEGPSSTALPFDSGPEIPTGAAVRGMAAGDLDHEGLPDLVLDTDRGLRVYAGGLAGGPRQLLGTSRQARTRLALCDMDSDGSLDLIFGDRRGQRVTVYGSIPMHDAGSLPFGSPTYVPLGTDASQVAAADVSGDGAPELVVLTVEGASRGGASFRIAERGDEAYTLRPGSVIESGFEIGAGAGDALDTGSFALADLDGDGLLDVLLASGAAGKTGWYAGVAGRLDFDGGPREVLGVPGATEAVATDLTGAGHLDPLTAAGTEIHALLAARPAPALEPQEGRAAGDSRFVLTIESTIVRQGQKDAATAVRLTNTEPLQGYSVAIDYFSLAVTPTRVDLEGSITDPSFVEFTDQKILPEASAIVFTALVDALAPFEGKVLGAGESQLLLRFVYDVREDAPLGETGFRFVDGVGPAPGTNTEVIVGGEAISPERVAGRLTVLEPDRPPPPDGNRLELTPAAVRPGEVFWIQGLASFEKPLEAFTAILSIDSSVFEVIEFSLEGTPSEPLDPELVVPNIQNEEGFAILTLIYDYLPPIDHRTLGAGKELKLFLVKLRASDFAPPGEYEVRLANEVGEPPLNNIFVFDGLSVFPELIGSTVRIVGGSQPTFVRGDFDGNLALDLADAVALANHLFQGGPASPCEDATDADDSGSVDLTDAIQLLNHLFKGGPPLPPPFPEPGTDPTPDELGCLGRP